MKKLFFTCLFILSAYSLYYLSSVEYASLDKVYLINLDRSADRLKKMQEILDSIDLPVKFTRFSAIDGMSLTIINEDTDEVLTGSEIYANKLVLNGNYKVICSVESQDYMHGSVVWNEFQNRALGELGHACSSRKIWKEVVENKYNNVLVLEDDVFFVKNFSSLFSRSMDNAPRDFDILYLNLGNFGRAYKSDIENKYLQPIMSIFDQFIKNPFWKQARRHVRSAKAYVVSAKGAKKLLECTKTLPEGVFLAADVIISKCITNKDIIAYRSKPELVYGNEEFKSVIGD
ncbi:MAG: glycosyltransferase family 25 protein [Pseudomonadota bacterium]